jgi:EmrB/QacA subfamily drug resistance transporter
MPNLRGRAVTAPCEPSFLATSRGRLTLLLLAAIGFLDFADGSIVNIALPDIRNDLHFSLQDLQWVTSGYFLPYGGFMLLGGRMADLLGRRRVLIAGTTIFAMASLTGGLSANSAELVGSRIGQGIGAALMMPAALSLITTLFHSGADRAKAVGAWAGVAAMASAVGVLLGGVLTEGPGWRWVLFVNPPIAALLLVGVFALLPDERPSGTSLANFDVLGSLLVTGGMVLLVYAIVEAPNEGWGSLRTIGEILVAAALLIAFVAVESVVAKPLVPLGIFRIPGLASADATTLIAIAGFGAMFFFLTLYMQTVLGFSPLQTGLAYLPLTVAGGMSVAVVTPLIARLGPKPVLVVGLVITGGGLLYLSRVPVDGTYLASVLPGLLAVGVGVIGAFAALTTAGNAGVPADRAGLAAALLNAAQQLGGALGLAVLSAIATARTNHQLHNLDEPAHAATAGFQRALFVGAMLIFIAAIGGLFTRSSQGELTIEATSSGADLLVP